MRKWKKIVCIVFICSCFLPGCACMNPAPVPEEKWDLIPMIMVDDVIYKTSGHASTMDSAEGVVGVITSKVPGSEKPTQNDQSNFGVGYEYRYGVEEGTIEIKMEEKWVIFIPLNSYR